jgi:hypothetical protein
LENGQVTSTTYQQQDKEMIQQIDPMDGSHYQPGNRCNQGKRLVVIFFPFSTILISFTELDPDKITV